MYDSQIEKMLVISTAHVTKETATALDRRGATMGGLLSYPHGEYGWMFYIAYVEKVDEDIVPDELMAAARYAQGLGCTWLLLDRDAGAIADLPTWEW